MADIENEDKKIIADEEREKMLNKENAIREDVDKKIEESDRIEKIDKEKELEKEAEAEGEKDAAGVVKTGEVEKMKKQLEESQKESRLSSIRVPIGGIKIPGFLRSRSRDKTKEGDGTAEEGLDLLEDGVAKPEKTDKPEKTEGGLRATLQRRLDTLAARSPFGKRDQAAADGAPAAADDSTASERPKLLDRLKLPAVSVLPKKFTRANKDQKDGGAAGAGAGDEAKVPESPDDGMESVKLDGDGEGEKDPEKAGLAGEVPKRPVYLVWLDRVRNLTRHEKAIGAALVLLVVLLIIIVSATAGGPIPTAAPVVDGKVVTPTQCGPVEGSEVGESFAFLGIPYAAPPTGKRRWKPAQQLNSLDLCWPDAIYRANNSSSLRQCLQETDNGVDGFEDCLYLDIWTPEVRYSNPVPVVVIIDTATLLGGDRDSRLAPTPKIVHDREVVFVRPNFRLNVFGFLAATPLKSAVHPPSSGNYGLTDIVTALAWVQRNIDHFGGDPGQVTLLGHRGGASLVTALTGSPAAKGLFSRAWATSGSSQFPGDDLPLAEQRNQPFVANVCEGVEQADNQLDCLLEKGPEALLDGIEDSWRSDTKFLPMIAASTNESDKHDWLVLDGHILKEHVWEQLKEVWRVPAPGHPHLVIGTTSQSETSAALLEAVGGITEEAVVKYVRSSLLGADGLADEALVRYNSTWEGLVTMVTDIRTTCPLLAMARTQPNITFYVATQARNHTGLGSVADVSLDVSAILGQYVPNAAPQLAFVKAIQDLFYGFISSGALPPLPTPTPDKPVLTVAGAAEWRSDYPNCGFWIDKNYVPLYARRD